MGFVISGFEVPAYTTAIQAGVLGFVKGFRHRIWESYDGLDRVLEFWLVRSIGLSLTENGKVYLSL